MPNLLLTLGHNSSAIAHRGADVIGYESERLNRIKSSSVSPHETANKALSHLPNWEGDAIKKVFISHWFDSLDYANGPIPLTEKYLTSAYVDWLRSKGFSIISLNKDCTHHDAHAWSAVSFFENHTTPAPDFKAHIIVCDGFGNRQETFSIYSVAWADGVGRIQLISRMHGYKNSLGLMYQYATSFCGMKEHQDEYKFLGYESHIKDVGIDITRLYELAERSAERFFINLVEGTIESTSDETFINTGELAEAKQFFNDEFARVLRALDHDKAPLQLVRAIIGFYIQAVIEIFYARVIRTKHIENLLLAGGVHYNVKLNNFCAKQVPGIISVVPLAGDQGAAIGLLRAYEGPEFPFKGLLWGRRNLTPVKALPQGVIHVTSSLEYVDVVASSIERNVLVNTVTGPMEFGPRALCNTSTLALPTEENVHTINAINGRDTVMPFAGAMQADGLHSLHHAEDIRKVVGSLHYMITTLDYKQGPTAIARLDAGYRGIAHQHPTQNVLTGRPQLVDQRLHPGPINDVLSALKHRTQAIINTSLNVHGLPIVHSAEDAINDFAYNVNEANGLGLPKPILVIGDF